MVKENHVQKTIIMPTALEDRLIDHVREMKYNERIRSIPKREQSTESSVICRALVEHLAKHESAQA